MKNRIRVLAATCVIASSALVACEAILGLQDRTLRSSDAAIDSAVDASQCDGDFCACSSHAFCDDFDPYANVQQLSQHWMVPNFTGSIVQLGGSLSLDNGTNIAPPTRPNALLSTVLLPTPLQGAGFVLGQVDASTSSVFGVQVSVQMRVVSIDPADGAPPLLDSGVMMFGGVLAVIDFTSKNGVGVALSEQGAYMGYALDVLSTNAQLAQGKQFLALNPASLGTYVQLQVIVARRSSTAIPSSVDCTPGPVLTDPDASFADAAQPADPVVIVVSTSVTAPTCEILSAELALPDWLTSPVFLLGSVVKGQGLFSVDFDNFTVDFLAE